MAERTDITIAWPLSPRIITVLAGGPQDKEIIQQDLLDTLRKMESDLTALDNDPIVDAAGKEDLGGGVTVGISTTLQNAQLAFEARTTPTETGTATSPGATTLEDSAAHFITKDIQRGALIINFTDFSVAEVLSVESQTQLTHASLKGGINNDWTIGDTYRIFNIVQCSATGGNLVAVDESGSPISSIFPSAFTQVLKTASSSATLQELSAIQYASFNGGVTIDVDNGVSGTAYPIGTPERPVNNIPQAVAIAAERGFVDIYIIGNLELVENDNVSNLILSGRSSIHTLLTVGSLANVTNTIFKNLTITGTLDGGNIIDYCTVQKLFYVNGQITNSLIEPINIELGGGASAKFINCFGGANGIDTFVIDMGGSGQSLALYNFSGEVKIIHKTGSDGITIGVTGAKVELDSSITAGTIELRGTGNLINHLSGTAQVDITGFIEGAQVLYAKTVYMDIAGESGVAFPIGTFAHPSNNIPHALEILHNVYGTTLVFLSDFDVPNNTVFDGLTIESRGNFSAGLTFGSSCSNQLTTFVNIVLTGEINGDAFFKHCFLENCTHIEGNFEDCMFNGDISFLDLGPGDNANIIINNGRSQSRSPEAAFIIGSANLSATNMFGFFSLQGKDTTAECNIHFSFGLVTIESSCTDGDIYLSGEGRATILTTGSNVISHMWGQVTDTVYVDTNGDAGTEYPIGGAKHPVKNLTDAFTIAENLGVKKFSIRGSHALPRDCNGYSFVGEGEVLSDQINLNGKVATQCYFDRLTLTGTTSGSINTQRCILASVSAGMITALDTAIMGLYTVPLGGVFQATGLAFVGYGSPSATILFSGSSGSFAVNATGHVVFENMSGTCAVQVDNPSGSVTFGASCTGGAALVSGNCLVTRVGTQPAALSDLTVSNQLALSHGAGSWVDTGSGATPAAIADAVWDELKINHTLSGSMGQAQNLLATISGDVSLIKKIETGKWTITGSRLVYYDTNGTTPLVTFNLYDKDGNPVVIQSGVPAGREPI